MSVCNRFGMFWTHVIVLHRDCPILVSSSEWRPLVTRKADSPTVRLHIPTVTNGSVTRWVIEIHEKEFSTSPQKPVFSGFDIAELDALFTPRTCVDAYFSLDPYDYQQNADCFLLLLSV
ncbi:hypothetical protein ACSBR1_024677 [Camellia fascicularis]